MYKTISSKQKITEVILKNLPAQLNYCVDGRYSAEDFISKWWFTGRSGGLRLTEEGDRIFRLAEIEYFECPIGSINYNYYGFVLDLNKKMTCPYYLGLYIDEKKQLLKGEPIIRLYDSRVAVMVNLYGSLKEYLDSVRIENDRRK